MSWRALLTSAWVKAPMLALAGAALLATAALGDASALCVPAPKACQSDCCPCPDACTADAPHQDAVPASTAPPSFRPLALLAAVAPWRAADALAVPRERRLADLPSDPGRWPRGPSRPQLSVWLI